MASASSENSVPNLITTAFPHPAKKSGDASHGFLGIFWAFGRFERSQRDRGGKGRGRRRMRMRKRRRSLSRRRTTSRRRNRRRTRIEE